MFKIDSDKTIHLTRGDEANIKFSIEDYQFQTGDKIVFSITEKREPANVKLQKEILVNEFSDYIIITLTKDETKIDNLESKVKTYWYEISLNDKKTVIGYDEDGPKLFLLYPESGEKI